MSGAGERRSESPRRGHPGRGPMGAMRPGERAKDFKGAMVKLIGYL